MKGLGITMLRKNKAFTMILAAAIFLTGAEGIVSTTSTAAEQGVSTVVAEDSQQLDWLPETESEFNDFVAKYGNLSVHDKYIVYSDNINYSTGVDEVVLSQSGSAKVEKMKEYNVPHDELQPAGSPSMIVVVYEAVSSGDLQITITQGRSWAPDAPKEETGMGTGNYTVNDDLTIAEAVSFVKGDVNADGDFNVSDVVLLQKWLLAVPDTHLANWKAADFCEDERLNVFDLCLMKRELINFITPEPTTTTTEPEITTTETETTTTTTTTETTTTTTIYPVENPEVIDEFTPCTATIDDDFTDWKIQVIIKCQYSDLERVWTADDFNGVENIKKIKQHDQFNPYRQVLEISLKKYSKEAVLQMIHDIEALGLEEIKEVDTVAMYTGDNGDG